MSDGRHVYLFRQAIDGRHRDMIHVDDKGRVLVRDEGDTPGRVDDDHQWVPATGEFVSVVDATLLVDRFVLVDGSLRSAVEVRYQRSRNRSRPQSPADSLGAKDLDGRLFHEPTQELAFVRNLHAGRFTALLIPTDVADSQRWQIFAHNGVTGRLDSYNVERSSSGLFSTRGSPTYTCVDHPSVFALGPGESSEPTPPAGTCGRPLVPRVHASGHAETALRFGSPGGHGPASAAGGVEVAEAAGYGLLPGTGELTLEAWLRPEADEPPPRQVLVGGGAPGEPDAGLWIWIVDERRCASVSVTGSGGTSSRQGPSSPRERGTTSP